MTDIDGVVPDIRDDALYFLPLGGSDEIGMNLYLYGVDGKWLMVDLGIAFGDELTPGIDVLMPDPAFIEERRKDLVGIVLTHAHEDHFGAVQYLWPRFKCPVYATPFAAALLRLKLIDTEFADDIEIIEVPLSGTVEAGPFEVELITVTHSIPEPNALVIRTRFGAVVHSGDWKLDPDPLLGKPADEDRFRKVGEEGVLALVCDSTNVLNAGTTGSEADVRESLTRLIAEKTGRVAVACFATNVARLQSIAEAAHANGRHCALVGRSLWRVHTAATETGYLTPPEAFVAERDVGYVPEDKIVLICTGSQGEPRAALTRIAQGEHANVVLSRGDTVIFSSREIPGNEKAINRVRNLLIGQGVDIITPDDAEEGAPIHVSGHPARDDLLSMYQWLKPGISIPVHGEMRHLHAHAELAESCQVGQVVVPEDGALIRLAPGRAEIEGEVPAGRLALDGDRLIRLGDNDTIRHRHRLFHSGVAMVSLLVNGQGRVAADPEVTLLGVEDAETVEGLQDDLSESVRDAVERLPKPSRRDDEAVREAARLAIRRTINIRQGKKPMIQVHMTRLTG